MFTKRDLPQSEWSRLSGWEADVLLPFADPDFTRVEVIENEAGEIIGAQVLLSLIHWHGAEVRADHRGKGAVLRLLLETLSDGSVTAPGVMTGAANPELEAQLRRLGAVDVPVKPLFLPLKGVELASVEE